MLISSAWIKNDDLYDFNGHKNKFNLKNKSKKFREAIQEADDALSQTQQTQQQQNNDLQLQPGSRNESGNALTALTLKNKDIVELLNTFEENKVTLRAIFTERRNILDCFNRGNGYDFVTVLDQLVSPEQQQQMCSHLSDEIAGKKYFENAIHEKLFWKIILPEWLIAICVKEFARTEEEILEQIKEDNDDSFNAKLANSSFNLSFI